MSKKDIFGDEVIPANQTQDFAALFNQSLSQPNSNKKLSVGDSYSAEILSLNKSEAFVSTPSHQDAMIPMMDLLDEEKNIKFKVGDKIDVVVVKTKGGEIRVSKVGSRKSNADLDSLEDAFDMELPVEGRVTEVCNGGFRVQVQNKVAFCPVSQMDYKVQDHESYVNKKFDFLISQFDPKGRNLVVSRRKLLDLTKVENEGHFMLKQKPGDIVSGTITRIEKFGAFVSLGGGVEGLCHISEIGWSRLQDPSEVVSTGQSVQVKIIDVVELENKLKISLSIKQAGGEGDPWLMVPEKFKVGTQVSGTVEKKEQYGLFVQIAPGVTGLLPRSKWKESLEASQFENKKKGDQIQVQVDEILFEQKRISLGVPGLQDDHSWREHNSTQTTSFATNNFGSLGKLMTKNDKK